jgi:hypothetical protein
LQLIKFILNISGVFRRPKLIRSEISIDLFKVRKIDFILMNKNRFGSIFNIFKFIFWVLLILLLLELELIIAICLIIILMVILNIFIIIFINKI